MSHHPSTAKIVALTLLAAFLVLKTHPAQAQTTCVGKCGSYVPAPGLFSTGPTVAGSVAAARVTSGCYCDALCWKYGVAATGDCCTTATGNSASAWEASCTTPTPLGLADDGGYRPTSFSNTAYVNGYVSTWNTRRYGATPTPIVKVAGVAVTVTGYTNDSVTFTMPGRTTAQTVTIEISRPGATLAVQNKLAWSTTFSFAYDVQRCPGGEVEGASCPREESCEVGICRLGVCAQNGIRANNTSCVGVDPCATAKCVSGVCTRTGSAIGLACDDKNACTSGDACGLDGLCRGAAAFENTPCDDGNECTSNGKCKQGVCAGGAPVNEGRICTAAAGACRVNQVCTSGKCVGGLNVTSGACNDGNPCSRNDTCNASGVCVGGTVNVCNDGNQCTDEVCNGRGGCF